MAKRSERWSSPAAGGSSGVSVSAVAPSSSNPNAALVTLRPIHSDDDHQRALSDIERLWGAEPGSVEAEYLDVLVTLVDAYEASRHAVSPPEPLEAIRFRMEQMGLRRRDLEPYLGSRARVSEVLSGRRSLTLPMIRRLRSGLGISADVLVGSESGPEGVRA
jgi:HTH-type transcriptional regulator/antitoxin HigA